MPWVDSGASTPGSGVSTVSSARASATPGALPPTPPIVGLATTPRPCKSTMTQTSSRMRISYATFGPATRRRPDLPDHGRRPHRGTRPPVNPLFRRPGGRGRGSALPPMPLPFVSLWPCSVSEAIHLSAAQDTREAVWHHPSAAEMRPPQPKYRESAGFASRHDAPRRSAIEQPVAVEAFSAGVIDGLRCP